MMRNWTGLVRAGQVQADTLVWHEGLVNWQPYGQVRPGAARCHCPASGVADIPAPGMSSNEVVCAECGRIFPIESTIQYGAKRVCAGCKPVFMQKIAEGAAAQVAPGTYRYAGFLDSGRREIDRRYHSGSGCSCAHDGMAFCEWNVRNPERLQGLQISCAACLHSNKRRLPGILPDEFGATPGKMACGLRVITADGGPIGFGRAVGRVFAEILSGLICYIGYIMVGFDAEKRALHDHICSTRVIYK